MPSYSGKRTYEMTTKKWSGGRNQRRDERRSSLQNRIGVGSRPMVSPWENGVAPGMQSSVLGQGSFSQPFSSSYLLNSGVNRGSFGAASYGGGLGDYSNKIRHLNRQMGAFDDQRGRGLLPNPTPLLGVAPQAFPPPSRGSDFLQQRMGGPWDSSGFHSGGTRGMSSAYYPSNRGRQDNSRRFLKAKRPQNKSSNNSSSSSKGSGPREGRGKAKGANSSNKSPSKGGDDKDRDSSSNTKSGKQGESPLKRERAAFLIEEYLVGRSDKDDTDKDKEMTDNEDEGKNEDGVKIKKETTEDEEGEKGDQEKEDKKKEEKEKQGYIRHLQGITHAKMAEVYHAKNAATLELLNISAKLAEMRQRDKVLRRTGKKGQPVMKTTEQILVQKWLKVGSCCGQKYKSPFGLEEHKLSIHHLRAKYMAKHKDEEEKTEETAEPDAEGKEKEVKEEEMKEKEDQTPEETLHDEVLRFSSMIENAQKEAEENPTTMNTLPVYNPSTMIGLEYISKELRFRCKVCKGQGFKALESHCQSHSHFDNIASHLNKEEDKKREEKRKQEEAEAAAKKKEEKEAKAKAKAKENEKKEAEAIKGEEEEKMEEGDYGEDEGGLSSEYITLDDCAKDKSDDEEMDEDVIPLGEEEERILNAKEEDDDEQEENKEEQENQQATEDAVAATNPDDEATMEAAIFEEIGEKIELENGNKEGEEEESQPTEEAEVEEPPQKRSAYTPRRRGRARSRTRNSK
ncbi:hypothetical protein Anas_06625 [Armadillidium nasatum]|uniref:Uncharacterized protein n=1 Tax=Armadillidium nasatum TaxID=96803 RepID=A0A5N5T8P0_9CRUS|nr:hypothetical protein Anas_06625 [Armadillidium nasatum]